MAVYIESVNDLNRAKLPVDRVGTRRDSTDPQKYECGLGRLLGRHPQQLAGASETVIDLGHETALTMVVVRGCRGQCRLAVSDDLSSWTDAGALYGDYATAPITLNRWSRYVRIGDPAAHLRQISVW